MSIETAPVFQLEEVRTHLHRARGYQPAASVEERFVDALLERVGAAVGIGSKQATFTKAELVGLFTDAETAPSTACACGHGWSDHLGSGRPPSRGRRGGAGCLECDACREPRPREVAGGAL